MGYKDLFDQKEMKEYRETRAKEREEAERKANRTAEDLDREARKKKRAEVEATLKARFMAGGGTISEWAAIRHRLVSDYLAKQALDPEPEPEPKKIPAPLPKSRYKY